MVSENASSGDPSFLRDGVIDRSTIWGHVHDVPNGQITTSGFFSDVLNFAQSSIFLKQTISGSIYSLDGQVP